jgi:hypothetical protein
VLIDPHMDRLKWLYADIRVSGSDQYLLPAGYRERAPTAAAVLCRLWRGGASVLASQRPCANLAHGLGHGPIGALVSAWPALALVGSFELLATLIRVGRRATVERSADTARHHALPDAKQGGPLALAEVPSLEQTVRAWHEAGTSQRAIARQLSIDRRKVKRIIEQAV